MDSVKKDYISEITLVADQIAAMIRHLSDTTIPLKGTRWTIGTASAHLVISQRLAKKILNGGENPYKNANPETVSAANTKLLEEFEERRGDKLATMLVMDTEALLKSFAQLKDSHKIKTHFGEMDITTGLSYNLCHLLIHGSQIAKALQKPLPVTEKHVGMVLPFLKLAMKATYDKESAKEFVGIFAIHLRNSSSYAVICNGQSVQVVDEVASKIDCHVSADSVTFFLVAAGIESQWQALFKGKMFVWGKKPWLALRLTKLFKSP